MAKKNKWDVEICATHGDIYETTTNVMAKETDGKIQVFATVDEIYPSPVLIQESEGKSLFRTIADLAVHGFSFEGGIDHFGGPTYAGVYGLKKWQNSFICIALCRYSDDGDLPCGSGGYGDELIGLTDEQLKKMYKSFGSFEDDGLIEPLSKILETKRECIGLEETPLSELIQKSNLPIDAQLFKKLAPIVVQEAVVAEQCHDAEQELYENFVKKANYNRELFGSGEGRMGGWIKQKNYKLTKGIILWVERFQKEQGVFPTGTYDVPVHVNHNNEIVSVKFP